MTDEIDGICDACGRPTPSDEIYQCDECGRDGLCPDCAMPEQHDCDGSDEE